MKIILTLTALMLAAGLARAQSAAIETVLSDQTTDLEIDLNSKTVKCSARGYMSPNLKVLVPGLADITVMNHRNPGEGAPCIAAGDCFGTGQTPGITPEDILQSGTGVDTVPVRVILTRVSLPDHEAKVCNVTLKEEIHAIIRGVPFYHLRAQEMAKRNLADCR